MSETEATDRALDESYKEECDRLGLLLGVNAAVNSYLDLQELLQAAHVCLKRVIRYEYTSLILHDPPLNAERLQVFEGGKASFVDKDGAKDAATLLNTPLGRALETKKPSIARSAAELLAYKNPALDEFVAGGFRSAACIPLVASGIVIASLNAGSQRENGFSETDVEFLWQVANQITPAVRNAFAFREIQSLKDKITREKVYLESELQHEFEAIIGESPRLEDVLKDVERVAPTDSTVMIWGETGTGKELIARAIHNLSGRKKGTFVKLNCAAIPTGLLESDSSGTRRARSRGLSTSESAASSSRMAGPSSWTRSATFRRSYSRSSCACSRNASSSDSAAIGSCKSTCGSSQRPIGTSRKWSRTAPFEAISITA